MTTDLRPTGEIHEAADLFPMLPDDELAELAEDIKANGLVHPIVLDAEGVLIDGRNRLAACRMVGVEPTYMSLNGHDPIAYILSSNVARRNLNQGQKAMLIVALDCSPRTIQEHLADSADVSRSRIAKALIVRKHAPTRMSSVIAGSTSLDGAYAEAKTIKQGKESDDYRFSILSHDAPELATSVREGALSTAEAWAIHQKRTQDARDDAIRRTKTLWRNLTGIWASLAPGPEHALAPWLPDERGLASEVYDHLLTADGLRELAALVGAFADAVDERGGLHADIEANGRD